MSTMQSSVRANPDKTRWTAGEDCGLLSTVVYRSRSVTPLSESALGELVDAAQRRNRAEGVTGLLIYDDGRFMQWLEGPASGLARIWESTRHDRRHTDIEVLGDAPSPERYFPDWDMKLGTRAGSRSGSDSQADALTLSTRLIATLQRQPGAVHAVLPALVLPLEPLTRPGIAAADHARLRALVDGVVVPELLGRRNRGQDLGDELELSGQAALARLLIAADPAQAFAALDALNARAGSLGASCAMVSEPAARSLGDLWAADDCSEFDVTIGLSRLQQSFRRLCRSLHERRPSDAGLRAVLIAPQPGEVHMLGAILDAEMLWRAGWDAQCEFPADDDALKALVAGTWFDAIDLCASPAFRREHRLPNLGASVAAVRAASRNPQLTVLVGGRVFSDTRPGARVPSARVGADAASPSASEIARRVERALIGPLPVRPQ